jgi:hypothetical protein
MLMRNERLAALRTRYDDRSHVLAISTDGSEAVRGDLETPAGRAPRSSATSRSISPRRLKSAVATRNVQPVGIT